MNAWMFFLNSNNYYVYMLIGAYKDLLATNTKYPIYCGITKLVDNKTKQILKQIGINTIDLDTSWLDNNVNLANVPHYKNAFAKLSILSNDIAKKFDKIVYLDTDIQIFENIDELMDKPHMSAVADEFPHKDKTKEPYKIGDSIFCSGLFIWDFKNNPNKGQQILDNIDKLDKNVGWHDQSVLNYYYKDWQKKPELHLHPTYCVMNDNFTIEKYNELYGLAKVIHYVSRPRDGWPFRSRLYAVSDANYRYSKWIHVISWLRNINQAIIYFKLDIEQLHDYNILFLSIDEARKIKADGRPNCYLYF